MGHHTVKASPGCGGGGTRSPLHGSSSTAAAVGDGGPEVPAPAVHEGPDAETLLHVRRYEDRVDPTTLLLLRVRVHPQLALRVLHREEVLLEHLRQCELFPQRG